MFVWCTCFSRNILPIIKKIGRWSLMSQKKIPDFILGKSILLLLEAYRTKIWSMQVAVVSVIPDGKVINGRNLLLSIIARKFST